MKQFRNIAMIVKPIIVDGVGKYKTRCGDTVTITHIDEYGRPYAAHGVYDKEGINESWDISGRIYPSHETDNDIIAKVVDN